jgi:RNA polymerase sigma factor (sigma-70 family)
MIEDYCNFTLEHCRDLIKYYQTTGDKHTFDLLLAKFDKFLGYTVLKLRRSYDYLRGEVAQDLYHTAILGFHKAILAFNCELNPEMITLVIRSYVRNELDIFYSYKRKEVSWPDFVVQFEENLGSTEHTSQQEKFLNGLSVRLLLEHPSIRPSEKHLLEGRYFRGLTRKEMADELGVTESKIRVRLGRALKKVRQIMKQSEGLYEEKK